MSIFLLPTISCAQSWHDGHQVEEGVFGDEGHVLHIGHCEFGFLCSLALSQGFGLGILLQSLGHVSAKQPGKITLGHSSRPLQNRQPVLD